MIELFAKINSSSVLLILHKAYPNGTQSGGHSGRGVNPSVTDKGIHPFIHPSSVPLFLNREPGVYTRGLGAQGVGQTKQGAKTLQATTYSHISDKLQMPVNLQYNTCLRTERGNQSTQRKPTKNRGNVQTP